jgi:hypothetical protein
LTLLNLVINSLSMFDMCSLKVPITIFVHFEKSGRQFLWPDREDKIHGKCLASWNSCVDLKIKVDLVSLTTKRKIKPFF